MTAGELKEMLAGVGYELPVLVKTAKGWKRVFLAYKGTRRMENTTPGNELEVFCIELRADEYRKKTK